MDLAFLMPFAGQMVVADPSQTQGRVRRTASNPHRPGPLCYAHQPFQHERHIRTGEAEIAMASLLLGVQQLGRIKLGEMPARGRQRHTRSLRQLADRQRPAVHHGSTVAEPSMPLNRLGLSGSLLI
jgi:hypothetical protein